MFIILCIIFTGTVKPSTHRKVFPCVLFLGLWRQTLTVGCMPILLSDKSISSEIQGPNPFYISMWLAPAPVPQLPIRDKQVLSLDPFWDLVGMKALWWRWWQILTWIFLTVTRLTMKKLTTQLCWAWTDLMLQSLLDRPATKIWVMQPSWKPREWKRGALWSTLSWWRAEPAHRAPGIYIIGTGGRSERHMFPVEGWAAP